MIDVLAGAFVGDGIVLATGYCCCHWLLLMLLVVLVVIVAGCSCRYERHRQASFMATLLVLLSLQLLRCCSFCSYSLLLLLVLVGDAAGACFC